MSRVLRGGDLVKWLDGYAQRAGVIVNGTPSTITVRSYYGGGQGEWMLNRNHLTLEFVAHEPAHNPSEFKQGDRVAVWRSKDVSGAKHIGKTGTVTDVYPGSTLPVVVMFDNDRGSNSFSETELWILTNTEEEEKMSKHPDANSLNWAFARGGVYYEPVRAQHRAGTRVYHAILATDEYTDEQRIVAWVSAEERDSTMRSVFINRRAMPMLILLDESDYSDLEPIYPKTTKVKEHKPQAEPDTWTKRYFTLVRALEVAAKTHNLCSEWETFKRDNDVLKPPLPDAPNGAYAVVKFGSTLYTSTTSQNNVNHDAPSWYDLYRPRDERYSWRQLLAKHGEEFTLIHEGEKP